jgi:hypothetical protein
MEHGLSGVFHQLVCEVIIYSIFLFLPKALLF